MKTQKFRKKPVVIEAIQFTGDNAGKIYDFIHPSLTHIVGTDKTSPITIHTHKGIINAAKGDWIIKDVRGEFYPCHPDLFEQTYDIVEDE